MAKTQKERIESLEKAVKRLQARIVELERRRERELVDAIVFDIDFADPDDFDEDAPEYGRRRRK